MNWNVYFLGIAVGIIVWIITGNFIAGAIVSIATRIVVGAVVGAKWN